MSWIEKKKKKNKIICTFKTRSKKIAKSDYWLCHAYPSVRPYVTTWLPMNFMKFDF